MVALKAPANTPSRDQHHDYVEEEARRRRRRRSSATSLSLDALAFETPPVQRAVSEAIRIHTGATPVPPEILRRAEEEVGTPKVDHCASLSRRMSLDGVTDTPQAAPARFAALSMDLATPVQRVPTIPKIIIDPASSRPSEHNARASSEPVEEGLPPWGRQEWKDLERSLFDERKTLAQRMGVEPNQVDVTEVQLDWVVNRFLMDADIEAEEHGDWSL